ncbi:MAG: T9SS type A sorting domain-containing protein [Bacteroidales bacterium]|nr:T9SS type A sorting domain-containing protein [Bacteroidales bacterium]
MNRKILILSFIILHFTFFIRLSAQDTWIQTYNPFNADTYVTEDVAICQDGGYAINGYYDIYDFTWEEHWGFLIKTDTEGNLLWAKVDTVSFMSENESLAFIETDDEGFLSAGSSPWGSCLIKRDSLGNRLWSMFNDFHVETMLRAEDGNIILGGIRTDNGHPGIRKITQEGDVLWNQDYYLGGSGTGKMHSIIQTSDGGLASTGYTSGNGFDFFVLRTNVDGDSLWCITYDGFGQYDEARSILENYEGDFFISGYLESNSRAYYGFLLKLTNQGEQIYILTDNNSNSYYGCNSMVEVLSDNKIVCYGRDIDGPALNSYNYNGDSLWVSSLSGWGGAGDRCLQLIDEGFILCGRNWQYDISLTKTDINGQVTAVEDEIIFLQDYKLSNYPNPFNPKTTIRFNICYSSNILLQIYNVKGQLVKTLLNEDKQSGEHTVVWDARYQSSGIYFVKLSNGKNLMKTCKILLVK